MNSLTSRKQKRIFLFENDAMYSSRGLNCTARYSADCEFTLQRTYKITNMHGYHSSIFDLFKASTTKQLKNRLMAVGPMRYFCSPNIYVPYESANVHCILDHIGLYSFAFLLMC